MEPESIQSIVNAVYDGLYSLVFLYLLIREQNSHKETREEHRQERREWSIRPTTPPDQTLQ